MQICLLTVHHGRPIAKTFGSKQLSVASFTIDIILVFRQQGRVQNLTARGALEAGLVIHLAIHSCHTLCKIHSSSTACTHLIVPCVPTIRWCAACHLGLGVVGHVFATNLIRVPRVHGQARGSAGITIAFWSIQTTIAGFAVNILFVLTQSCGIKTFGASPTLETGLVVCLSSTDNFLRHVDGAVAAWAALSTPQSTSSSPHIACLHLIQS